jgi:hypothetical protein
MGIDMQDNVVVRCCRIPAGLQPATSKVSSPSTHQGCETEVMTDMASQGQAVARQQIRWLEGFVLALATAAVIVALGLGAFTALSAPTMVAQSKTATQIVQDPGLLEQRAGERGGAVAEPGTLPKLHPYVSVKPTVRAPGTMELPNGTFWTPAVSAKPAVRAPGTLELPNGTIWSPSVSVHPRGHTRGHD